MWSWCEPFSEKLFLRPSMKTRLKRASRTRHHQRRCQLFHESNSLNPSFAAECQINCDRIGAIHQPHAGDELEEPYEATARIPGQQARRNFDGIDQREPDKDK